MSTVLARLKRSVPVRYKQRLPPGALHALRAVLHLLEFRKYYVIQPLMFPVAYNQDDLITSHNCDFRQDPLFAESYRLASQDGAFEENRIEWRVYVACWAAQRAASLEGDFVECGVFKGGISRAVVNYVDFNRLDKTFYLLDTYEGLARQYLTSTEAERGFGDNRYSDTSDIVRRRFKDFNVRVIKGPVPETLSQVPAKQVSYLSIDMNCTEPEIAAAEFFWPKLVSGAAIVLDDYGFALHLEQKHAFDVFAAERGVRVLSLPTGQGLIFKP